MLCLSPLLEMLAEDTESGNLAEGVDKGRVKTGTKDHVRLLTHSSVLEERRTISTLTTEKDGLKDILKRSVVSWFYLAVVTATDEEVESFHPSIVTNVHERDNTELNRCYSRSFEIQLTSDLKKKSTRSSADQSQDFLFREVSIVPWGRFST